MKLFTAALFAFAATNNASAFAPSRGNLSTRTALSMTSNANSEDRRSFVTKSAATTAGVALSTLATSTALPLAASAAAKKEWVQIKVPFEDTVYDISFDSETHGYIVGARGSFAETNDGGLTWEPRSFSNLDAEEEITYRFEAVSFKDGEGWVLGKPTLLLHTKDSGKSWERIPLSPKLPGEPTGILALGPNQAEMITSSGAVYTTDNAGRNWKAQVKETIDATLNRVSSSGVSGASYFTGSINNEQRDSQGAYLAVSSRGNFFLTWEPGQDFWIPHNRGTPRRIQNMGFVRGDIKNGVWMTLNGGKLLTSAPGADLNSEEFPFAEANIKTGGYGITDVAWRDENEVWAVGGSNTMFVSKDNGKNFSFDKSANDIPGNLYNVKFFPEFGNAGWALGSSGLLLKYVGEKA
mmetsp:Transcript_11390/g.24999  ORF Transcript_11390/g.24999 Transcript_11390/m.24999 type:complete len:409 (+) Transcript_11390:88-1314(+)|eukprot:CAMPEP_0172298870 /NCGR_PEP_ID=MMETSP1058-20130122/1322_1 /TAXON_ID=83371 /ORGANISM="Detonula confervacea, Strain CCMP 353" /LENGTH=408 /DNA_ID=CAMNT_0013008165 /DNA_START=78 /DNA_END=1304 /DNA_ORIENTATION=+